MTDQVPEQTGGEQPKPAELDNRMDKLEAEQARQGGMLEQILDKVAGSAGPAPAPVQHATEDKLRQDEIVREATRAAVAAVKADTSGAGGGGKPAPEQAPREHGSEGFKGKLQAALFGRDD